LSHIFEYSKFLAKQEIINECGKNPWPIQWAQWLFGLGWSGGTNVGRIKSKTWEQENLGLCECEYSNISLILLLLGDFHSLHIIFSHVFHCFSWNIALSLVIQMQILSAVTLRDKYFFHCRPIWKRMNNLGRNWNGMVKFTRGWEWMNCWIGGKFMNA
jgi:hypothetical protein